MTCLICYSLNSSKEKKVGNLFLLRNLILHLFAENVVHTLYDIRTLKFLSFCQENYVVCLHIIN